jgi:hypothetical protein
MTKMGSAFGERRPRARPIGSGVRFASRIARYVLSGASDPSFFARPIGAG